MKPKSTSSIRSGMSSCIVSGALWYGTPVQTTRTAATARQRIRKQEDDVTPEDDEDLWNGIHAQKLLRSPSIVVVAIARRLTGPGHHWSSFTFSAFAARA